MSDDRIYIRFKGKTLGPLSEQKVRDLVRRGQITRMHELSSDGLAWQRAEEFGDFFAGGNAIAVSQSAARQSPGVIVPSGGVAVADGGGSPAGSSQPIPGQAADDGVQWYAYVGGENQGPIRLTDLMAWIESGDVTGDTPVWRAGFDEWQPASAAIPDQFSASPAMPQVAGNPGGIQTGVQSDQAGAVPKHVVDSMTSQRSWVLTVSIMGLVWSGLNVVYFVTSMIVGAEAKWVPVGGSRAVVYGLTGLVLCGVTIAGQVLLLGYASSLKTLATRPDSRNLGLAMRRLRTFWKYCAIVMIVVCVLLIGSAVLLFVMLAAATDAVT